MKYYKTTQGDYTSSIGTSIGEAEITQEEYEKVISEINNYQVNLDENTIYRLKADLTWEIITNAMG